MRSVTLTIHGRSRKPANERGLSTLGAPARHLAPISISRLSGTTEALGSEQS
jgi:hypothetical protein